jgi:hypothetical protein
MENQENNRACRCPSCQLLELRKRLVEVRQFVYLGQPMGPWTTKEVLDLLNRIEGNVQLKGRLNA